MPRILLTDEHWLRLKPILLDCGIYDKPNLRLTIEGILYKLRVGCCWRDVLPYFGKWKQRKTIGNSDSQELVAFNCDLFNI